MKRSTKILLGFLVAVPAGLVGAIIFFLLNPALLPQAPEDAPRDHISAEEIAQLDLGDLVLHRGMGLAADMIVLSMNEPAGFTHCALVAGKDPLVLVHSLSSSLGDFDGVQTTDIQYFNKKSFPSSIVALRPSYAPGQKDATLKWAWEQVQNRIPFNNFYDLADTKTLYCSQYLTEALRAGGFYKKEEKFRMSGPVLAFSNFLEPQRFQVLFSHNPLIK